VIQKNVQDPLAEMLLSGRVSDGQNLAITAGPLGLMIGETVLTRQPRPSHAALN